MELDSVRALKSQLAAQLSDMTTSGGGIMAAAVRPALGGAPINVAAQQISRVDATQRSVAFGVAPSGRKNFKLAVRIQRQVYTADDHIERFKKAAKGEVDIRYIGRVSKRVPWYQRECLPVRPGCSIGHFKITAGTLGCFVRDKDGVPLILSNNHVLANENRAKRGDNILQPGAVDGGKNPGDRIGGLLRFVRLKPGAANLVDCAVATVDDDVSHVASIRGLGAVTGLFTGDLKTGLTVAKLGRTTGLTHGIVTAFELDNVVVSYDLGNLRFDDQVEIEGAGDAAFSDGGDSGSLIVNDACEGVALLFAGGDHGGRNGRGLTYANPLGTVLKKLRVSLV